MLRDDLFSISFLKKIDYYGEYDKMRFRISKDGDELKAEVYPGPYNLAHTPKDKVETRSFAFSDEGYEEVKKWLEEELASRDWGSAQLPL